MNKNSKKLLQLVVIGLMAAIVFVTSKFLTIPIATIAGTPTRIHFGNVMCILSGLLFGGLNGGLASGIGSGFVDLLDPIYLASTPSTVINKFVMGFVAGKLSHAKGRNGKSFKRNIISAVLGQLSYIILYLLYTFFVMFAFYRNDIHTVLIVIVQKAVASSLNGIIAVIIAVPLAMALRKGLSNTRIYNTLLKN